MHNTLFTDALADIGYQRIILRRIVISASVGIGFRFYKDASFSVDGIEKELALIPYLPVTVSIGYPH